MGAILPGRKHPLSPFIVEPVNMREASVRAVMFTFPEIETSGVHELSRFAA
jgi:hypothetical protein